MESEYWQKQLAGKPLFPDLLWSRPENKQYAGKLLIIGGNSGGFSQVAKAYTAALTAGIGVTKILLPDALARTVANIFSEAEFAPSNPSGGFATKALAELSDSAAWADGVLIAGDLGKNSETAILLEKFITEYKGQLTIANDGIDYFSQSAETILNRPGTTLVLTLSQLQKLAAKIGVAITSTMTLLKLIEALHGITKSAGANVVTWHEGNILVASAGKVSTTKTTGTRLTELAASCSVWQLQNPARIYDALTTACADHTNNINLSL